MTKVQFIRKARQLGFTDLFISEVLALKELERKKGIKRRYANYLPDEKVMK